jgi:hypothetical protein
MLCVCGDDLMMPFPYSVKVPSVAVPVVGPCRFHFEPLIISVRHVCQKFLYICPFLNVTLVYSFAVEVNSMNK